MNAKGEREHAALRTVNEGDERLAGLVIRPVRLEDAEAVAKVLNEAILARRFSLLDTPVSTEDERHFIAAFPSRGVFHVAELAGEGIVGVQVLEPYGQYATHEHDHVVTMGTWVREAWRGRGIGRRLAAASFAVARERGFKKVFTDIRADNFTSLAFHIGLGFVVVGTARRHAKVGDRYVDVIYVEKFL